MSNPLYPIVAGIAIRMDEQGRFNLNDLHKASGKNPKNSPAQWLRTKQAQKLMNLLEKKAIQACTVSTEGRNGGTFAHEILAVEYTGWISMEFRIIVNETFIDYKRSTFSTSVHKSHCQQLERENQLIAIQIELLSQQNESLVQQNSLLKERIELGLQCRDLPLAQTYPDTASLARDDASSSDLSFSPEPLPASAYPQPFSDEPWCHILALWAMDVCNGNFRLFHLDSIGIKGAEQPVILVRINHILEHVANHPGGKEILLKYSSLAFKRKLLIHDILLDNKARERTLNGKRVSNLRALKVRGLRAWGIRVTLD